MRCGEVHEYLFAYLDNELDVPLSIEFQRHLEQCHECAREVEIEWAIKRHLGHALETAGTSLPLGEPALREAVEEVVTRRTGVLELFRRFALRTATAAAVVFAVGIGVWLAGPGKTAVERHNGFADLVVSDFEHFLEKGRPLQIASVDRLAVAGWLRDRTKLDVMLPESRDGRCRLIGGRKCTIGGRVAAFAAYDVDGMPASLVVMEAKREALNGMEQVNRRGQTHWLDRCKGHTIVARRRDRLVYAAVSTLPEAQLLCLVTGVGHEGD